MVKWTKPTVDTKFHIDFDWWEEKGHNFRVHLFSNLCKGCQERYRGLSGNRPDRLDRSQHG